MEDWLLMQTFYHGLTTSVCENIDAAAGGSFLSFTIHEATTLVEKIASNQEWNEECTQPCKRGGMHQVKKVDMLSAKMDLLMKKLDEQNHDFVKSVEALATQEATILKSKRMSTISTTTPIIVLNRIKDGTNRIKGEISNKDLTTQVTTQVTTKVTISTNHL
jgi:hypothetical protein